MANEAAPRGTTLRLPLRVAAGALCGVSAWCSLGTLAVASVGGTESTVGLLPRWSWLALCVAAGITLAHVASRTPMALFLLPAIAILPWAGATAPIALVWAGASIAFVWSAVAVGIAHDLSSGRMSSAIARCVDRAGVALALSLLVFALVAAWTRLPLSGDEPHYLVISSSMLRDGDVELANEYDEQRYREFYAGSLEPRHTKYTPAGRHYPIHGLGTSALVAPAFALGGVAAARAAMLIVTALGAALLWTGVRSATGSSTAAWFALALLVLQVPFATQSFSIYPDPPAAAVTACALWMLSRIERTERLSTVEFAAFGLVVSTLPWLHIRLSILAASFGAAVVLLAARRRLDVNQLAWFFALPIVSAALWMASSYVMFESLNPLASLRHAGAFASIPVSIAGLLTDQEFGLLPFAPGVVFGGLGLWNRSLPITSLAGALALVGTLVTTASHDWWGGTNSPARFLVPVLPVLAFGAGNWWQHTTQTLRRVGLFSVVIAATVLAIGAVAGRGRYLVNIPDGRQSLFAWFSDSVDIAAFLPSFFKASNTPSTEVMIAGFWILTGIVVVVILAGTGRRRAQSWTAVSCGALVWIALASTLALAATRRNATTHDRSQFALLAASPRPSLATGVGRLGLMQRDELLQLLSFRLPTEDTLAIVRTPQMPAGRYQLEFTAAPVMPSNITIHVGRNAEPIWELEVRHSVGETFTLGAPVRTVIVTTADFTSASEAPIRVRPRGLLPIVDPIMEPAQYVKRYDALVVYTPDQLASLEATGFWLWAGRRTSFVITTVDGAVPPLTFSLRAGGAPVDVRLTRGAWQFAASLAAQAATVVTAPPTEVIVPFVVETSGRRDPQGVWVAVR